MVNVGDLKNEELPLQFFLDYAWNPSRWPLDGSDDWERRLRARRTSAPSTPAEIAEVLHDYGQLQSRRKPELLNRRITLDPAKDLATDEPAVVYDDQATPFSLTALRGDGPGHGASGRRWRGGPTRCAARLPGGRAGRLLPARDYQVKATANLYELRQAQFTNMLYATAGPGRHQRLADEAAGALRATTRR